jgi:quercetin dioxygenase-like cupin family protein
MSVKHLTDVPIETVNAGEGVTFQVLISSDEAPNFAMRRFIMEPGGGMPNHTNAVEHEQFVLRGHARIGIGDAVFEVNATDIVFIPAGVPHWYQNIGDEPFEFLCLVPNKPDTVEILE